MKSLKKRKSLSKMSKNDLIDIVEICNKYPFSAIDSNKDPVIALNEITYDRYQNITNYYFLMINLQLYPDCVLIISFNDDKYLYSGSSDNTILFCNIRSNKKELYVINEDNNKEIITLLNLYH
ncbi:hypothetical protein RFI_37395 [Reticulomyxa filosa]|uniref:Uncharacterized protein n=1 Tax=Reticulomyxa filosa TaxID=46433 RepID=X6LDI6_RETFI|nr:hypothetical protein RFI_37395 [Reticulomyxa filosa]|eukprot:ETO00063.1 hypothetical protein RFI_37395 [Reticulomyxa filosa]